MALGETPVKADKIATFSDTGGAAKLRYDVPLPGHYRGRRVVALTGLGLADADWRARDRPAADALVERLKLQASGAGYVVDVPAAVQYWFRQARANGVGGDKVAELERFLAAPEQVARIAAVQNTPAGAPLVAQAMVLQGVAGQVPTRLTRRLGPTDGQIFSSVEPAPQAAPRAHVPELWGVLQSYLDKLGRGTLEVARPDGTGGTVVTDMPLKAVPKPRLALVEVYAISSFLGDYGLGRTVKTMSLLPGEELTMRFRTWRSSETSVKECSSIFDSATVEAKDRFQSAVQKETTDKRTQTSQTEWHVDAEVGASWGWGQADISGGGSGQYHSGREEFGRQINEAGQEHAREASNKRDTTVTSGTERTERLEQEETTQRVIRNVNLRRTLNFVFRELNQTYDTYVHLVEVKIGYSDGTPNSWREVPLSGLRNLLEEVLVGKVDQTAKAILDVVCVVFDHQDVPQKVIDRLTWDGREGKWRVEQDPRREQDGTWAEPAKDRIYRYKRGKIGQDGNGGANTVEGVVLRKDRVVLRTDSVLVEALLGEADALDDYAMVSQKADAEAKALANDRADAVNRALAELGNPERVKAYADIVNGDGVVHLDVRQTT